MTLYLNIVPQIAKQTVCTLLEKDLLFNYISYLMRIEIRNVQTIIYESEVVRIAANSRAGNELVEIRVHAKNLDKVMVEP